MRIEVEARVFVTVMAAKEELTPEEEGRIILETEQRLNSTRVFSVDIGEAIATVGVRVHLKGVKVLKVDKAPKAPKVSNGGKD